MSLANGAKQTLVVSLKAGNLGSRTKSLRDIWGGLVGFVLIMEDLRLGY